MELILPLKSLEMEMYARKTQTMPRTSGTVATTLAGKVKMTRNSVPKMRITCKGGQQVSQMERLQGEMYTVWSSLFLLIEQEQTSRNLLTSLLADALYIVHAILIAHRTGWHVWV